MIEYEKASLAGVVDYYVKGFQFRGKDLLNYEAFVDTAKDTVVFRFVFKERPVKETDGERANDNKPYE